MSLPFQRGWCRATALACALLLASGGPLLAANAGDRAFKAAADSFNLAVWWRAEAQFEQFIARHPKSERVPEAVLLQAQAQFKQGKFEPAIALLTARLAEAGPLADQYLYWIGEAQYQAGQHAAAAETFGKLVTQFPASNRRLEAAVDEAAACATLGRWPRVVELLDKAGGPFQTAAPARPESQLVVRGRLLLGEARLKQKQFAEAEAALQPLALLKLPPESEWQRLFFLCQAQLGGGKTDEALRNAEALRKLATTTGRPELLAESVDLLASILEKLGKRDDAIATLKLITTNAPPDRQREALLRITALTLQQGQVSEAMATMESFLSQFSNAPAADAALLNLGELHLKEYRQPASPAAGSPPATNHLQLALDYFNRLVTTFTNSALVGRAQLGRGWCYWISTNLPASAEAFSAATATLPPSEARVEARCKLADVQFATNDFSGAVAQYASALAEATNWPATRESLVPKILHQLVRANVALTNADGASAAMRQLLELRPDDEDASRSVLLVGQGFLDAGEPVGAATLFKDYLARFPAAPERPTVELLMARALEGETNWTQALVLYNGWLDRFPTNRLRPQVEFRRALATYRADEETNALSLFTNFVARFGTNELAARAQWWVADHYYGKGEFNEAEKNYKGVFQNWPNSSLTYAARMMAGWAAFRRPEYGPAIEYFKLLTSDKSCPSNLWIDAMFAYGGTLMLRNAGDTNNPFADIRLAIDVFAALRDQYPNSDYAARAWGEIGKCYFQLGAQDAGSYQRASNAFQQAIVCTNATVTTRSQAQVGLGLTLEAQASNLSGGEQIAALRQALDNYLDVVLETNLAEGESPDLFWVKKAGLEAARLAESMQEWPQAIKLYQRLGELIPPLKASLERRIQKAQEHSATGKS